MAQRVDDRGLLDGGNDDGNIPVAYPQDVSIMTTVPVTADGGSAYPPPSAAAAAASASAASASVCSKCSLCVLSPYRPFALSLIT